MFNIGSGEMIVIFLLALLVLGPERLPKAMGQVGRAVAQMRKLSSGFQDEIKRAMDPIEAPFRPGEETLHGPVPAITDEVRVVNAEPAEAHATLDETATDGEHDDGEHDDADRVTLAKAAEPVPLADADVDVAVDPATQAVVVDDDAGSRGTVTPLRPRPDDTAAPGTVDGDAGGDGDRATG